MREVAVSGCYYTDDEIASMETQHSELHAKYQRAIEFLRDIADLAGTTKRKQAGCEIAAHALAQLGESRSSDNGGPERG